MNMEKFLLKANNRFSEKNESYTVHHSYKNDIQYNIPITNSFEKLVAIKDLEIKPSQGIMPHRHKNTELITIILSGSLIQKNNIGDTYSLNQGDIQIMNTGSGISHFEYNKSSKNILHCIQFCFAQNTSEKPNIKLSSFASKGIGFHKISSEEKKGIQACDTKINRECYYGFFEEKTTKTHTLKNNKSSVIIFNLEGVIRVNNETMNPKDTLMLQTPQEITILSQNKAKFFLIEI